MKKIFFTILLLVSLSFANAQSGWQAGNYYSHAGTSQVVCGNSYWVQGVYGPELWQTCQKQIWNQSYYSGYVYIWTYVGWAYQSNAGYYWSFYWQNYNVRLR